MSKAHFTDIAIKALKAPARGQVTYWDASLPAFGIRVSQGGTKAWTVVHGEKRKRISIGRYPAISLQQARSEAKRVLAQIALGGGRGVGLRFEEALLLFLTTHCAVKNRPGTAKETERLLRRHFLAALKHRALEDISTQDFTAVIDRVLGTPSEAQHAFTAGKTFFRWAARRGTSSIVRRMDCSRPANQSPVTGCCRIRSWDACTLSPAGAGIHLAPSLNCSC